MDGYLLVSFGHSDQQSQHIGTLYQGHASIFHNTVTAYGSATPVRSFTRNDGYSIDLIDISSFQVAWTAGAVTRAQGLANITDDVFTRSLAREIVQELRNAGLI